MPDAATSSHMGYSGLGSLYSRDWTGPGYWTLIFLSHWTTGLALNHKISFSCTVMTTKIYCQASAILYWETFIYSGHPLGPSQLGGGLCIGLGNGLGGGGGGGHRAKMCLG